MQLSNRIMEFYCSGCKGNKACCLLRGIIESKEQLIESKETIIEMLRGEIEDLKHNRGEESVKISYRDAVSKRPEKVIVVKPKNPSQDSSKTKKTIEEKVEPSALGIGVSRINRVKEGGVVMHCSSQQDGESICEALRQQMGGDYSVIQPQKRNPRIKIVGVDRKLADDGEALMENIIAQNHINTPNESRIMKILRKYENRKGGMCVIIEVDPVTYSIICRKEALYVGWRSCRYYEHLNVVQCFGCWRFGHMARDCRNGESVCPKCASKDHKSEDCQSAERVCVNCRYASETLRVPNIDLNHAAFDRNCMAYKKVCERQQQKIRYPDVNKDGCQK